MVSASWRAGAAVVAMLGCVALGGCSDPERAAASYTVEAVHLRIGEVLETGSGFALYVYLPDKQGRATCAGVCAAAWPPLLLPRGVRHAIAGRGVRADLLGTTRRSDGSLQVTYNRWPLYRDVDDAPGETSGQGDGMGAWYLISTDGSVNYLPVG